MKKNVTFQLEESDIEKLKQLAASDNRSIASYLRNLVIELIKDNDKAENK